MSEWLLIHTQKGVIAILIHVILYPPEVSGASFTNMVLR